MPIGKALELAAEADLDLVEVAPMARPPVCKLMDYGKFKYESAQKAREARRNQALTVIKEMKLRPKIDPHDYETKKGHVERFLKQGDKVKITIMFRGREQSRPELGFRLLQRLAEDITDLGFVESSPKQDGRNMVMVVAPHRSARSREPAPSRPPRSRHRRAELASTACRLRRPAARPAGAHQEGFPMPKNKTHSGMKKRVKVTGSGKLLTERAGKRHLLERKSSRLTRRLTGTEEIAAVDVPRVKRLLGR